MLPLSPAPIRCKVLLLQSIGQLTGSDILQGQRRALSLEPDSLVAFLHPHSSRITLSVDRQLLVIVGDEVRLSAWLTYRHGHPQPCSCPSQSAAPWKASFVALTLNRLVYAVVSYSVTYCKAENEKLLRQMTAVQ